MNVFLYDPIAPDPDGIITSGHGNKTGRTIALHEGEKINEGALLGCFARSSLIIGPEAGVDSESPELRLGLTV